MWKWIVLGLAVFGLYRLFVNDRKKKAEAERQAEAKRVADGDLVKDPECGTFIDPDTAVTIRNGDKVLYFCCHDCRSKYLEKIRKIEERKAAERN